MAYNSNYFYENYFPLYFQTVLKTYAPVDRENNGGTSSVIKRPQWQEQVEDHSEGNEILVLLAITVKEIYYG